MIFLYEINIIETSRKNAREQYIVVNHDIILS